VRDALAAEGFGVLTEIDDAAVFKAKLGLDRPPLKILGACDPEFAHRVLEIDSSASLLLPCNVVLEPTDGGTKVTIAVPRRSQRPFSQIAPQHEDQTTRAGHSMKSDDTGES
jgi:uncharacterized protein (DUF302 family)